MLLAWKSCFVLLLAFYVTTPYSLYVAEEEDDANEDGTESDDESLMATLQSANASEEADFEQMAASNEESDAERKGITQDTSGISIDSQPGLTSQANLNGFAATFRGQNQFPEETVMSTTAVELKAVGWENSQLPGLLISSGVVAHSGEIWIVLFGKCLTILFLNI